MAFNDAAVSPDKIETVVAVTGFEDHALISNALRSNQGNVDTVVNEFLDDSDKVCLLSPRLFAILRHKLLLGH